MEDQKERKKGMNRKRQVQAVLAISIMLIAGIGIAVETTDNKVTQDSDAELGMVSAIVVWAIIAFIAGIAVGSFIPPKDPNSDTSTAVKQGEANLVASSILQGVSYTHNTMAQLQQIWNLTDEHFIRYAELAASFFWGPNVTYSADDILLGSTAYANAAIGITNSTQQTSQLFQQISDRLDLWNKDPSLNIYATNMTVLWTYGNQSFGSNSQFNGNLTSVATAKSGADYVYISDSGSMWISGSSNATITSEVGASAGDTYTLQPGNNDLTTGFTPGIYKLQDGITYAGPMVYVIDANAAQVVPGIVMEAGGQTKLAIYDPTNNNVIVDGQPYTSLGISVKPNDGQAVPADIKPYLADLESMMVAVNKTLMAANAAASAVWNIFDINGAASAFITTLIVPDNYNNVDINTEQKTLMTLVAMQQLSQFIQAGQINIQATDFQLSSDSLTLFCRGDIYDNNGQMLYQNVIFTPLFYNHNVTLTTGNNTIDQPAIIAIWDASGNYNLSSWNFMSNTTAAGLPPIGSGCSIYVYEMELGGQFVNSAPLEVRHISFITSDGWDQVGPVVPQPPPAPKSYSWQLIMIIAGIIILLIGMIVPPLRPLMYLGMLLAIGGGIWLAIDYFTSNFSFWHLIGLNMGGMHELQ